MGVRPKYWPRKCGEKAKDLTLTYGPKAKRKFLDLADRSKEMSVLYVPKAKKLAIESGAKVKDTTLIYGGKAKDGFKYGSKAAEMASDTVDGFLARIRH